MSLRVAVVWGLSSSFVLQMGMSQAQVVPEEIVVVSTGLEETLAEDLSRYGSRLEVITAADLERQGFSDLAQALQMLVPGLHIAPKNGAFDYFDASLQGSRTQEILWLVDGVRITNRLYNSTSPLDTIPSHIVDRVEILKGGQGIFYGTQSVGGVVNIVTRSAGRDNDGAVNVGINSNEGFLANGHYRNSVGPHQFVFYASKDKAAGYTPYRREDIQPSATDRSRSYDVNVAGARYVLDLSERSRVSFQYQRTENKLDFLAPFATRSSYNEREEDILTAKYDFELNDSISLYLKAYYHDWDTLHTRRHNVVDAAGNMTGAIQIRDDDTYWGYEDYGMNTMLKLNLVEGFEYVLGLDHQNFSGADDVWRIADQEEQVNAAFGQIRTTEALFERTTMAFGMRRNEASNVDGATVWNLSGQHELNDDLYVRATLGTSFRLPDAEALFLNEYYDEDSDGIADGGWFAIGNPDLEPEQSRNANLGIGGNVGTTTYELIGFKRRITKYIAAYVPLVINGVEGEGFVNTNDEVDVEGMELIASVALNREWRANLSFTHTRAELNDSGSQLPEIPKTEGKLHLDYQPSGQSWGASIAVNYVGDVNTRRGQTRGNYAVADISGHYQPGLDGRHQIVLRIENVGDKVYTTRVDSGTRDIGGSYLYRSIGTGRTLHLAYTYHF